LLNGFVGPAEAGYPTAWALSLGLAVGLGLVLGITVLSRRRRVRSPRVAVGVIAALLGSGLLLVTHPGATATSGPAAIGRGLAGLGIGLLTFAWCDSHRTMARFDVPAFGLGVVALVLGAVEDGAVRASHLLVVYPVAAVVVALAARTEQGPVARILRFRALQWLGERAFSLFVLHAAVVVSLVRLSTALRLNFHSAPVAAGLVAIGLVGSLVLADLSYRHLEQLLGPRPPLAKPPIPAPRSAQIIDLADIPAELRLLPLPRKPTASDRG
jgi:peptidoglycan/LPS O-acetylase OafA/YrhL